VGGQHTCRVYNREYLIEQVLVDQPVLPGDDNKLEKL
jgi:hypothetical protein